MMRSRIFAKCLRNCNNNKAKSIIGFANGITGCIMVVARVRNVIICFDYVHLHGPYDIIKTTTANVKNINVRDFANR